MTTSFDYLEAAKIEELTTQFRNEGFDVTLNPTGDDEGYDLVAEKNGAKVAVEVKFNARLRESAETIKALRRRALERGYDEFRLVVVSPPHETNVHIEGFEERLLEHLRDSPPERIKKLPNQPSISDVRGVDIDSITISSGGTRVSGNGVVRVSEPLTFAHYSPNPLLDTSELPMDFPFNFEIKLDSELRITEVYKIDVDTSSWLD